MCAYTQTHANTYTKQTLSDTSAHTHTHIHIHIHIHTHIYEHIHTWQRRRWRLLCIVHVLFTLLTRHEGQCRSGCARAREGWGLDRSPCIPAAAPHGCVLGAAVLGTGAAALPGTLSCVCVCVCVCVLYQGSGMFNSCH